MLPTFGSVHPQSLRCASWTVNIVTCHVLPAWVEFFCTAALWLFFLVCLRSHCDAFFGQCLVVDCYNFSHLSHYRLQTPITHHSGADGANPAHTFGSDQQASEMWQVWGQHPECGLFVRYEAKYDLICIFPHHTLLKCCLHIKA